MYTVLIIYVRWCSVIIGLSIRKRTCWWKRLLTWLFCDIIDEFVSCERAVHSEVARMGTSDNMLNVGGVRAERGWFV